MIKTGVINYFVADSDVDLSNIPAAYGDMCYVIDECGLYIKVDNNDHWARYKENEFFE